MIPWRRIIGLFIISALLVSILVEVVVRIFVAEPEQYVLDSERGRIPAPHSSRWQANEGAARSHYNDLSLRGQRDELPIGPETRIMVLGDSLTEAVEVEERDTFAQLLEFRINAEAKGPVHVINAGRMAYQAGDMLWTAQKLQPQLQASYAIAVIRPFAFGVDDNQSVTLPGFWTARYVSHGVGGITAERVVPEATPFQTYSQLRWIRQHVALIDAGIRAFLRRHIAGEDAVPLRIGSELLERRIEFFIDSLQELYRHNLMIVLVSRDNPLRFGEVVDPLEEQVQSALEKICKKKSVTFWYTRPSFEALYRVRHLLPAGFANSSPPGRGHLNRVGHLLVAERLSLWLGEQLERDK